MHFTKKWFRRPLYKKILPLRKNVLNNNKIIKFKKLKWQKFQQLSYKRDKKKFYNPISYFLSSFKNFFSKKFKYNLNNKQRLSFFYGKMRKDYLKTVVKIALKNSKKVNSRASILFVQKLEARLDTALYRAHFCHSYYSASQFISHKKIYVNNQIIKHKFFELKKGDLITLDSSIKTIVKSNLLNSNMWPIPPKHFYINYKTLQILVLDNIEYTNCFSYYNFWIDFNSFIRHYTR
jgi:ribosomal protein S4